MVYTDRFQLVDDYLVHFDSLMTGIADPFIQCRYLGFITTAAVTAYELAIKNIFYEFADRKHVVLGAFVRSRFEKLNGRILLRNLKKDHVAMFGIKYVDKFKKNILAKETGSLSSGSGSPSSSYGNIITWRHTFVHEVRTPSTTNYDEVKKSYLLGKEVIHCLNDAMQR